MFICQPNKKKNLSFFKRLKVTIIKEMAEKEALDNPVDKPE